ncbi:MAG: hypothetical protein GF393_06755 [Armatimonadia bacterium]|nr:hypothetical protein [Armatimonadia bacterium]
MGARRWPWHRNSRRLRRLTILSTAVVAVVCLVTIWPADRWWLTAPLTWAPQLQWAFLPAALALWSVLASKPRWLAVNLAATAFIVLGPAGLETGSPRTPTGDTILAVTHNLAGRVQMTPKLSDHWVHQADVLCIQEAAADGFARLLTEERGFDQAATSDVRTFVRGRILRTEAIGPAPGIGREFLACHARIRGRDVAILNVHFATNVHHSRLSRSPAGVREYLRGAVNARAGHCKLVQDWLDVQEAPTLVLGDFNTPPTSAYYRRLAAQATDAFSSVGRGPGYTYMVGGSIPVFRIDYVWCANGMTPVSCGTGGEWASDHKWVEACVELP